MIIYGTRSKQLTKQAVTEKCTHCGSQNTIDIYVFQQYAHVFWIPFFPIRKIGISQCDHCQQALKQNEMPDGLRDSYNQVKAQTKIPIWTFSGIALIAVIVAIGIINGKKKDERNAQLILTPKAGDIFEIKTPDNNYSLVRVTSVNGDTVYIQQNEYQVDRTSGLDDLRKKDYSPEEYGISKSVLKTMLEKGDILDIERK